MKRPKRVKLGGHIILIEPLTPGIAEQHDGEYNDTSGISVPQKLKIYIRPDLPDTLWLEVFLHELTHTIDVLYMGSKLTEQDVCTLGAALADILLNNKLGS